MHQKIHQTHQIVSLKICEFSVFLALNTSTPLNYSDGSQPARGVGPGGGGSGLRLLVYLRGVGREYYRPRHLLRGEHHGPDYHQSCSQHYGRTQQIGEGGGEAGGGDGGQYHQHHHQPHHHGSHHRGAH